MAVGMRRSSWFSEFVDDFGELPEDKEWSEGGGDVIGSDSEGDGLGACRV
jgi:hypothetical protein